jgi:hypothetical protein
MLDAYLDYDEVVLHDGENPCIQIKSQQPVPEVLRYEILQIDAVLKIVRTKKWIDSNSK